MNMGGSLSTAFGTASSSAAVPITMQNLVEKNHVDQRIVRYTEPRGLEDSQVYRTMWARESSGIQNHVDQRIVRYTEPLGPEDSQVRA